jgi:hypothetical protein
MKKKAIFAVTLSLMLMSTALFNGCNMGVRTDGNFKYEIIGRGSSRSARIIGLSNLGNQQKFIVIPKEIRGKNVSMVHGAWAWIGGEVVPANFESDNLEKVFFQTQAQGYIRLKNDAKVFALDLPRSFELSNWRRWGGVVDEQPVLIYIYSGALDFILTQSWYDLAEDFITANVTYYLNYDTNTNFGVHWIDDVDDGELIEFIPPDPVRPEYQFADWYTEPENINKWDFATDTVNDSQQLFAKWIKV